MTDTNERLVTLAVAMPSVEPLDDLPNVELRPSVGWAAHCRACGYNLTEHMTEYACWGDRDGAENDATHADMELVDCPGCSKQLGKPVCEECGEVVADCECDIEDANHG